MRETPIGIEKIGKIDSYCIVAKEKLIELKFEKSQPQFKDYCLISKQEKAKEILCGLIVYLKNGQPAGITGHEDGNIWFWEKADKSPKGLIDYKCPIVSIKSIAAFVAIATAQAKVYLWDIPTGCILSVDLGNMPELNIISTHILNIDIHGEEILILTSKDVILAFTKRGKLSSIERINRINSLPGTHQNVIEAINGGKKANQIIAVSGDAGGISIINLESNEFCGALQVGETVTAMHSNTTEKFGYTLVAGTINGNIFVFNDALDDSPNCYTIPCLKSKVIDIKISPNGMCLVCILEDHNCALFERKDETFENCCQRKYFLYLD